MRFGRKIREPVDTQPGSVPAQVLRQAADLPKEAMADASRALDQLMLKFDRAPLETPIFINSVPKCGTLLLRNILLMFPPVDQVPWRFVSNAEMPSLFQSSGKKFFTGHVVCDVQSTICLKDFRHILIIRDPYDYVLSLARFLFGTQLEATTSLGKAIREHNLQFEDVIRFVITGWDFRSDEFLGVRDIFLRNAMYWDGAGALIVKYEDIVRSLKDLDSHETEGYWRGILGHLGILVPEDWRERIRAGADPAASSTIPQSLGGDAAAQSRRQLTPEEIKLFNRVAPDLRRQLGYADSASD